MFVLVIDNEFVYLWSTIRAAAPQSGALRAEASRDENNEQAIINKWYSVYISPLCVYQKK